MPPNCLTPRLIFHVDLENTWNNDVTVLGITGEMLLRKGDRLMGLTSLNALLTNITIKQGGRSRFDLGADLNFRQIEIVEEERKGGDVQFRLVLRILSSWVNGRPQRQITRFSHSPVTVRMARWAENLRIPESEWLKMLDQMGYERLRLIELPIPEPPIGTVIDSSLRHIEEARKCFNEGDYDDVLVNCRKTIEEIEHAKIDLVSLLESIDLSRL